MSPLPDGDSLFDLAHGSVHAMMDELAAIIPMDPEARIKAEEQMTNGVVAMLQIFLCGNVNGSNVTGQWIHDILDNMEWGARG